MLHLPILRGGRPYRSLQTNPLRHVATGELVCEVSQANAGLIARDLAGATARQRQLQKVPVDQLLDICREAARLYVEEELLVGDERQSPEDYVRQLSATTGLPHTLCRANMSKTHFVLDQMETVLGGLTRGLDLSILDSGWIEQDGRCVSYLRQTDALGAVLPSNSPGVHSLWIPAVGLKVALFLKPGRQEPWTPYRVLQALAAAGCPEAALGFYPADHAGASQILVGCKRTLLFGDQRTVGTWASDPRVELHGPGWSKVLLGRDGLERWHEHLETIVASVASNGGRSCVNASGVWAPDDPSGEARTLAEALAERLSRVEARPLDDPEAELAAFSDPRVAHRISAHIDRLLLQEGADDLTARFRSAGRVTEVDGCTFLLPTVVWCDDPDHPLAQAEYLFPFVSVVALPQEELLTRVGSTLVATVLSQDAGFLAAALTCSHLERLNLSPIPTSQVTWDQPHEGNLFEHLYHQRALQGPPPMQTPVSPDLSASASAS